MHHNSATGVDEKSCESSSITEHISKGFINFALGAISSLDMNTPHGVRCIAKAWITAISGRQAHPRNPIGTNVPIAKPINPTPMGLRLNPHLLKRNPTSAGLAIIANIEKVITKQ